MAKLPSFVHACVQGSHIPRCTAAGRQEGRANSSCCCFPAFSNFEHQKNNGHGVYCLILSHSNGGAVVAADNTPHVPFPSQRGRTTRGRLVVGGTPLAASGKKGLLSSDRSLVNRDDLNERSNRKSKDWKLRRRVYIDATSGSVMSENLSSPPSVLATIASRQAHTFSSTSLHLPRQHSTYR